MTNTTPNERPKNAYKDSLNLPKTSFPMRANLAQNEAKSLKRWEKQNIYSLILKKNEGNTPFVFHDGPPYANGSIHVGHLLNKVLKDIVVRSQNMLGKYCSFVPGWDCHGLPIEHKVMGELLEKKADKLNSVDENTRRIIVRAECKKYAEKYIRLQSEQMQSLLTLAHYNDPYLTMTPSYEKKVLDVFADLLKEDIVFRQLKPVHWSLANQTALAEAELEYYDKKDTSVYVNFELKDQIAANALFNTKLSQAIHVMIWTTTPWTLPANLAICVHNDFIYSLVSINDTPTIVAKALIPAIIKTTGLEIIELAEIKGSNLVGLDYLHPFCDRTGTITYGTYVTLEDGTGLVHTAPGHGIDDYQTGLRENLDVYCPVDATGHYDTTVPTWLHGKHIWDANPLIVDTLKVSKHLIHDYEFLHSYPHDWRSKTPVIFRSTEQWFIGVDKPLKTPQKSLRELALSSIENDIEFIPAWGQNRLRGMLESRPDWCLSRQRAWGLPIPAFRQKDGSIFLTEKSVRAISECFGESGSDAWFKSTPEELLSAYNPAEDPAAPANLEIASLEKMFDIFDVWFESGSSWNAVLKERKLGFPADLYLEGSDQHRGWFHLSLLPSLGVTNRPPYKKVLTHGFIVDKEGKKMSKSVGNTINVDDLLKQFGAETTRWWVSSLAFENDIKVDLDYFNQAGDSYRKVRNTVRFLLSSLDGFPIQTYENKSLQEVADKIPKNSIDAYALQECSSLVQRVKVAYNACKFKQAHSDIYNYCNDTLSALYCAAVKDRLYCDKTDSPRRIHTQETMWIIVESLSRLLSPILPHTADELYQSLHSPEHSIHLCDWEEFDYQAIPEFTQLLATRTQVLKALENVKEKGIDNTLDAGIILPKSDSLSLFSEDLADIFGVSRVSFHDSDTIEIQDLREEARCERSWKRDGTVKERSDGGFLSDRDALVVGV
jgi:isoleucyl-tRNA synthetase